MISYIFTNEGRRESNQDVIFEQEFRDGTYFLSVIDGMGGHKNGSLAAKIVEESIITYLSHVDSIDVYHIQKALNKANLLIKQKNSLLESDMGATFGGIAINKKIAQIFWLGDVKVFHYRDNRLHFETRPHNLINELNFNHAEFQSKRLDKYKHVVTRSIHGSKKPISAEFREITGIKSKDVFLVCSDGADEILDSLQIEKYLQECKFVEAFYTKLKSVLLQRSTDNFSIGVVEV